jgi:hypothetical protein
MNTRLKTYRIEAGAIVSEYQALSEENALDIFATEAGYQSYQELVNEHGNVDLIEEV